MIQTPKILLLDDRSDVALPTGTEVIWRDPRDPGTWKEIDEVASSFDLILIDQNLDLPEALSFEASDGASLVSHFRWWERTRKLALPPLVLLTNEPHAYAGEIPWVGPQTPLGGDFLGREHRIAPRLDVEWILFKQDDRLPEKIVSLLDAQRRARLVIGSNGTTLHEIRNLLNVPDAPWAERVLDALPRSRPPVSQPKQPVETNPPRGPTMVLRWLLHRVLPYPGLLLSNRFAAWTLNVTEESFEAFARSNSRTQWERNLRDTQYTGPLRDFMGPRHWTAGVEFAFWQVSRLADEAGGLQQAFDRLVGEHVLTVNVTPDPIVIWTDDLQEAGIESMDGAIQIHPPGWPAEAHEPWLRREEVQTDPILAAMADPDAISSGSQIQ